jgi:hypothetical protein
MLDLLILLWDGGVVTGEVEVVQGSIHMGHDLLEILLLLVLEAVLLLVVALVVVVLVVVVILIGGVELLPLEAVGDEVSGVATLKAALRWSPPLSLRNLCKTRNFLASKAISSSGMLSYYSLEAAAKEDRANSKADETVMLVGLASWPPTRALVIKVLLVRCNIPATPGLAIVTSDSYLGS